MTHEQFRDHVSHLHAKGFVLCLRRHPNKDHAFSYDIARRDDVHDTGLRWKINGMAYPVFRKPWEIEP